jgi:hypothetical protein
MSDLIRGLVPWILVPGVLVMVPMVVLRARWGSSTPNSRFIKLLVAAAVMMTLTVPAIGGLLDDRLGLVAVHRLICDCLAIYLSRQAALGIRETSQGPAVGHRVLNAGLTLLSVAGVGALITSYVGLHQTGADLGVLDAASLQPWPLTFWVAFCVVHGTNMAFALGDALRMRRSKVVPVSRRDRSSLTWWIVACLALWAYILNFPVALLLISAGKSDHFIVENTQLLQSLPGLVGCIAAAVCAATWADMDKRVRHFLLRPVWAWCTRTDQDVVLHPPMFTPKHRLVRRRAEISLATSRLLTCTSAAERAQVAAATAQGALPAKDGWGLLLHAGRRHRLEGRSPQALVLGEELPPGPNSWWRFQLLIWQRRRFDRLQAELLESRY